ncbi:hypothetical protein PQD76_gp40 [Stenotrophomonas phage BUCT626]|uniref:Uncharacterized protein n=1 Tax=Stenotrophomonas phage BUCT626 TaxID=2860376 RepID=A0AC61NLB2_9CAUD|nr:hypothetical protein PQD76_gp40 [Stenotrophomonas phage BUCT626]QYC96744.1 hypothetical protein [Stenotrophomonas phage BUCT626]
MSKHDSNITVHVWAPDIRSQVEKAKLTLEHYAVEFSTAKEAWEIRWAKIEAWKSKRLKMNFDHHWNKCLNHARMTLQVEYDMAFREWHMASEKAAEAYATQKRKWYEFKTPLRDYRSFYSVEERGQEADHRHLRLMDPTIELEYAIDHFFNTVKDATRYHKLLSATAPFSHSLGRRLMYATSSILGRSRIYRDFGPCELKRRRECNLPPIAHPHLRHAEAIHDLTKAVMEAGSHMINVPARILAAVNTINGEEA